MNLRIAPDGVVRGLWTDDVDWPALGRVSVRRASHVEFDEAEQAWTVREYVPRCGLRRIAQRLLGRSMGKILFHAHRREEALAWERAWFGPGGRGWPAEPEFLKEERRRMFILNSLWGLLTGWLRPPQTVRDHDRRQAYGPRWSRRRPQRIGRYTRRDPRRGWRWR